MTTLRQQFIRELVIRGTSPRTQESYVAAVYGLAKHYHKAPDQLGDEQIKNYMFYLAQERKLAPSSLNVTICALRSFYQLVLQRPVEKVRLSLPWVARAVHRPRVYSVEELEKLLTVGCPHPKHRAFLMTVYGAGLRLNEARWSAPAYQRYLEAMSRWAAETAITAEELEACIFQAHARGTSSQWAPG